MMRMNILVLFRNGQVKSLDENYMYASDSDSVIEMEIESNMDI